MANEIPQNNEVTAILNLILGYLKAYGLATLCIFFAGVWFVLVDHFSLVRVTEETDWMKPRVQSLWYKSHPDMSESVDATQSHIKGESPSGR